MSKREEKDQQEDIIRCWCGAQGTYDELFDDAGLERGCSGTGMIHCDCGGDFCVCHHHGEAECPGCEDCEGRWGDADGEWYDPDDDESWMEDVP